MYLVDSGPGVVLAFSFDGDKGTLNKMRVLITVDPAVGAPDGMTVDTAGDLWVAVYGGSQVRRYSPDDPERFAVLLRERFDALIVPSAPAARLVGGHPRTAVPAEYAGGFGASGLAAPLGHAL